MFCPFVSSLFVVCACPSSFLQYASLTIYRHTGYPGGIKSIKFHELLEKHPSRVIIGAVKGMMPKNALNRRSLLRLKVYNGTEHPHQSQKPKTMSI